MTASAMGGIGLGANIFGGIFSAFGANKAGQNQQAMYNYQAQVARINADIDRQNAAWALQKGDIEATQFGMKAAQQFGAIKTAQAASGLDVNSGSNVEVQASQRKLNAMDLDTIRKNAGKIAYDYNVKAVMDENQAGLDMMAGRNAAEAGRINAMSSIIGTVGSVSSKWIQGNQAGLWG